ncbi:hypothetical protein RFI_15917 [Reticulomyxa filosa]|uniref:RGS domain-containing protein n=1 Tax=Reticulomyxa filosa TaxID=46433 RepID=X6N5J6_RETFI|nr:hypothetical protein RFI_15917 [Reticulomyxa filosa]|eukprot:ETO21286.1 hypothetical protein RFI_15917 [Reticulomyxa filosa]
MKTKCQNQNLQMNDSNDNRFLWNKRLPRSSIVFNDKLSDDNKVIALIIKYIKTSAQYEVNLPYELRTSFMSLLIHANKPNSDLKTMSSSEFVFLFDKVLFELLALMRGSYSRFATTDAYKTYVEHANLRNIQHFHCNNQYAFSVKTCFLFFPLVLKKKPSFNLLSMGGFFFIKKSSLEKIHHETNTKSIWASSTQVFMGNSRAENCCLGKKCNLCHFFVLTWSFVYKAIKKTNKKPLFQEYDALIEAMCDSLSRNNGAKQHIPFQVSICQNNAAIGLEELFEIK